MNTLPVREHAANGKKEWVAFALIELEAFVLERLAIEKQIHLGLGSGDGHGDDLAVLARKV